ncbi:MAG: HAD-IA family hydrolase [Verrucomicrobiota bacterium]
MRKAVLFDLDGTLLDTLQDLATSGNEMLANRGMPTHPVDAYRTFIGDGMASLVQRIFPADRCPDEVELEVALQEYKAAYGRHWTDTTVPFEGISTLLDSLKAADIPIGVLSNKSHDFTLKCVEEFLSDWEWDIVLGARDGIPKKPDPAAAVEAAKATGCDPANCFFVGDSDVDILTGVNAGMHAIGVAWGFRSIEELTEAGAERVISAPGELLDLLA